MISDLIKLFSIGTLSFLLIFFITPITRYLGMKLKIFDVPNNRKLHKKIIIRSGGITIFSSFFLSLIISLFFIKNQIIEIIHLEFLLKIIFCSFLFFLIGFIDDFLSVNPFIRLSIQILLSCLVWSFGFQIKLSNLIPNIHNYYPILSSPLISLIITVIWITGFTNAINWLDGMDGIVSIFTIIVCLGFIIISFNLNNTFECILLANILGCSLGFLFQNTGQNKMFMGDSGSYFLGFSLSTIGVVSTNNGLISDEKFYFSDFNLWVSLMMLFIPFFDMARVIIIRLINSKSPFYADKNHIHHFLLAGKYEWKEIIIILVGLTQFTSFLSFKLAKITDIKFTLISLLLLLFCLYTSNKLKLSRLR